MFYSYFRSKQTLDIEKITRLTAKVKVKHGLEFLLFYGRNMDVDGLTRHNILLYIYRKFTVPNIDLYFS